MKYLSLDCAIKNCGWAYVSETNNVVDVIDFGLLNFSEEPEQVKCKLCDDFQIKINMSECELIYCCDKHTKEINDDMKKKKKKKQMTSQDVCKILINKLNGMAIIKDVDAIILENQPSFMNPVSKAIQTMLLTYFTLMNKLVIIQNPNQKLFGFKSTNEKKKYAERKTISKIIVKKLIPKNMFNKLLLFNKIDDICDAILMCFCQISLKNKTIVDEVKEILMENEKKK